MASRTGAGPRRTPAPAPSCSAPGGLSRCKKKKGKRGKPRHSLHSPTPPTTSRALCWRARSRDAEAKGVQVLALHKCELPLMQAPPTRPLPGQDPEAPTPRAALLLPVILGRTTPRRNAPGGVTLGRIAPGCVQLIPRGRARHQMSSGASLPPAGMRALAPVVLEPGPPWWF